MMSRSSQAMLATTNRLCRRSALPIFRPKGGRQLSAATVLVVISLKVKGQRESACKDPVVCPNARDVVFEMERSKRNNEPPNIRHRNPSLTSWGSIVGRLFGRLWGRDIRRREQRPLRCGEHHEGEPAQDDSARREGKDEITDVGHDGSVISRMIQGWPCESHKGSDLAPIDRLFAQQLSDMLFLPRATI
jgi:hypothetical protein